MTQSLLFRWTRKQTVGRNGSAPAHSGTLLPSDTGSVSTETWTRSHLAYKKLFFSRTITQETRSIFSPESASSHHNVPLSFSLFGSHMFIPYCCTELYLKIELFQIHAIWSFPHLSIHVLHLSHFFLFRKASSQPSRACRPSDYIYCYLQRFWVSDIFMPTQYYEVEWKFVLQCS